MKHLNYKYKMNCIIFYYDNKYDYLDLLNIKSLKLKIITSFYHLFDLHNTEEKIFKSLLETLNELNLLCKSVDFYSEEYLPKLIEFCNNCPNKLYKISIISLIDYLTFIIDNVKNITTEMIIDKKQLLTIKLQESINSLKLMLKSKCENNYLQQQLNAINISYEDFINEDDIIIQNKSKSKNYGFYKNEQVIKNVFKNLYENVYQKCFNSTLSDFYIQFKINLVYTIDFNYLKYININKDFLNLDVNYNKYTNDIKDEIKKYLPKDFLENNLINLGVHIKNVNILYNKIILNEHFYDDV